MITITLTDIRACKPCEDRWVHLLKALGKNKADTEILPLERILDLNGIDDALWALRAVKGHDNAIRLFACHCAQSALHVFEREYPDDPRPRQAIETAEQFARGRATERELKAAKAATRVAAGVAWDAAYDAARAAADAAAWDAAGAADAVDAVDAAVRAAWDDFISEFCCLCRLEGQYEGG